MKNEATQKQAGQIERATLAIIDALERVGVMNDATLSLAAVGGVVGCLCAALGDPEEALASVNAVARGIISGDLLD